MIEERLWGEEEVSPPDSERFAREISALVRSLDKLSDIKEQACKNNNGKKDLGDGAHHADNTDRWREEIASRIARLQQAGNSQ